MTTLGKTIRMLRRDRRIWQPDLAERAYISLDHLCHIESGKNPSVGVVNQICAALELPQEERRAVLVLWMKEQGVEW